jgi:hypothetical protein
MVEFGPNKVVAANGPEGINGKLDSLTVFYLPDLVSKFREVLVEIGTATGFTHKTSAYRQELFFVLDGDYIGVTTAAIIPPDMPDYSDPEVAKSYTLE